MNIYCIPWNMWTSQREIVNITELWFEIILSNCNSESELWKILILKHQIFEDMMVDILFIFSWEWDLEFCSSGASRYEMYNGAAKSVNAKIGFLREVTASVAVVRTTWNGLIPSALLKTNPWGSSGSHFTCW